MRSAPCVVPCRQLVAPLLGTLMLGTACGDDDAAISVDAGTRVEAGTNDTGVDAARDAGSPNDGGTPTPRDAQPALDGEVSLDGETPTEFPDSGPEEGDAGGSDASAPLTYDCRSFDDPAGWTVRPGLRAVVVADADDGLMLPVGLTFAGGDFEGAVYVVCNGDKSIRKLDLDTGDVTTFVEPTAWDGATPTTLTSITWDAESIFDGALYVADVGSNSDGDSVVFRVRGDRTNVRFVAAPRSGLEDGLDDVFSLAFAPRGSTYAEGLYIAGDTDSLGHDWGRLDSAGEVYRFSDVAGIEGHAFDVSGDYGRRLFAARPLGGGYAGDGTITAIDESGVAAAPLAQDLGGIHAVTFSPGGAFGQRMFAASWAAGGELYEIAPDGAVTSLARGAALTNYDGNVLAFSPDGSILLVADHAANRIVCIEPVP